MGLRNDYRVSTIIVLCKDCGQDVGLYPARHECSNVKRPHLPTLCSTTDTQWEDVPDLIKSGPTSATVTRQASDSSIESGKWNFFRSSTVKNEESSYYVSNLKNSSSCNDIKDITTGKKLWGKVKENEKWKELVSEKKDDSTKQSGKLWSRIMQVTMSNTLEEAESDDEDWEGETHVSRILREYYESKNKPLPSWLFEQENSSHTPSAQIKRTSGRRLWQQENNTPSSAREREIEALRNPSISRTRSERTINSIKDDFAYGSVSPRRTNTTRSPARSYNNNIPSSVRSQNYF
ncbi:hypothetical protein INT48_007886 [Thamnidium elegans]|uniref:Mso1 N-terminal domain-containing protein n=1 Tax=Thamnidium elegans TaxID=101142 RepID=A0A8H7SW40_9FUNG|nr:hypothetical protein INT48_007886 [Thamnidium elegans]